MNNDLPPDAKLVFKGVVFEVWQWEQKMFDGSTEIFEKIKRPDSADVIAVVGDKILMETQEQPHRPPFTCVPGGHCDENEDPMDGAKRELLEETGYASKDWALFRERRPFDFLIWTMHTFIARNCQYVQASHLDAGEKITISLVSFDEFIELSQKPDFRDGELALYLLRAKFEPDFKEKLRKKIFG